MSLTARARRAVIGSVAAVAACLATAGPADAAVIFEQGADYHVIGYEAGGLPDGSAVGMVVLRVQTVVDSGQMKILTTVEDVIVADGWSYEVVKPGGVNSAVEVELFNDTCSGRFKALYKPGKTVIDGGVIRCR